MLRKVGKRWEPCTLKRAIIVMLADMQKSLMPSEEQKKRDCLKTLAKRIIPQYVVSKAYITVILTTFCGFLLP